MEAFLASFLVVFLAELGDKTQFIVMAFTAKYRWQSVFAGMTLGILVVHSLAVAVGSLAGQLIPVHLMTIIASCLFIGFGVWTLRGDDEEEEENVHPSRFGPLLTVAMTFIVGEMGDKTQFAAMTMAAQYESWLMVLAGAVAGMVCSPTVSASWQALSCTASCRPRRCAICRRASSCSSAWSASCRAHSRVCSPDGFPCIFQIVMYNG